MSQPQPSDPVEDHFRNVEAVPPLTVSEERALWDAVRGGDGADAARRRLIEANLQLVAPIAVRYEGRDVAFVDLVEEGHTALVRAVELFDPSGGQSFTSFASQQIKRTSRERSADRFSIERADAMGPSTRRVSSAR